MSGINFAVCALIFNEEDKILAVSRKDDRNDWGLPGGKLDEGETFVEGLKREVLEETGLEIDTRYLIFGDLTDNKRWYVPTYLCTVKSFDTLHTPEKIKELGEGDIKWADWSEIETGFNGSYNRHLHYVSDKLLSDMVKEIRQDMKNNPLKALTL